MLFQGWEILILEGLIWEEVKKSVRKTDKHKHKEGQPDETGNPNKTITIQFSTNKNDEIIWSNGIDNLELGMNNINKTSSNEDILKDHLPFTRDPWGQYFYYRGE